MAKLAVLFLLGLLLVQYAAAGKIKRDVPQPNTNANNVQQNLEEALKNLQNMFQNAFSQDQMEAFGKQIKQLGDTLGEKGMEFLDAANDNINKLKTSPQQV